MKIGTWFMKYEDFSEEYNSYENSMAFTLSAIVIEVNNNSLDVMGINNEREELNTLYNVNFAKEGNTGFKQGQEILIFFDGMILETFPGQINNVGRIEIIREKSEIEIPDDVLRFYNNSEDKVEIKISELTNRGLTIEITDSNQLPYEYSDEYVIYKEVKNEKYTGVGEKVGEDTENSTSGYTGTGTEYIWEELEKNVGADIKSTIEYLKYNLPNIDSENSYIIIGKKIDWTPVYGELEDGKYRIIFTNLSTYTNAFRIQVEFSVNDRNVEIISIEKGL